jgi:hypothetical protein
VSERFVVDVDAAMGDVVECAGGYGLVTAVLREGCEVAPLVRGLTGPAIGRGVPTTSVPEGPCVLEPLGGDGERVPIFDRHPVIVKPRWRRWTLGSLVYDLRLERSLGGSVLATGPRELLYAVMQHQVHEGRIVIIAAPARTTTPLDLSRRQAPEHARDWDVFDLPHIRVTVGPTATEYAQWLVPWTAAAIADALRARGKDVVLVVDGIDAWKFPCRMMPERGTWATQIGAFTTRAFATETGSVSIIAHAKTAEPSVAYNFDDAIDLKTWMTGDFGRIQTKIVRPPVKMHHSGVFGGAMASVARLSEIEPYEHRVNLDLATKRRVEEGRRVLAAVRYRGVPIDLFEQQLVLLAVLRADIPSHAVIEFTDVYLALLRSGHADLVATMRAAGRVSKDDDDALTAIARGVRLRFS